MSSRGLFNGHTWIIVLTAVLGLILMGCGAEGGLIFLLSRQGGDNLKALEALGVPAIPMAVVKGIEMIVKRLTYIPEIDKTIEIK